MCGVCGCGEPGHADHHHHHGETERVRVERDLLERNDAAAAENRAAFGRQRILALNLVSSPGAGKTTLLARTLADDALGGPAAVIEGDQASANDSERIRATGTPALQVTTGAICHLDADQVAGALDTLDPASGTVLFVENVGNLLCPAGFDLGEAATVLLVSVTEGADKPDKYPNMFAAADLLLVTKLDLQPHVGGDLDGLIARARAVNPGLEVLQLSAADGQGLEAWYRWIRQRRARLAAAA